MKWLLSFLFCLTASAQIQPRVMQDYFESLPQGSSSITPTNITGYPALAYYVVHWGFDTNAGNERLLDLLSHQWHLTNTAGARSPWRNAANLNGKDTLQFDSAGGSSTSVYLRSGAYTSSQPHEVYIVMKHGSPPSANQYNIFFDGMNLSGARNLLYRVPSAKYDIYAGTDVFTAPEVQNKWMVFNAVFNGSSSFLYTNNVAANSNVNPGSQTQSGFTVGALQNLSLGSSNLVVAAIVTYATNLSAAARLTVFQYFTNLFALAQ